MDLLQNGLLEYPLTRGPNEFIEDQVERSSEAHALSIGTDRVSYLELNSRSNRLAHFLREQGADPGTRVGVYLDRSLDSVISLLALFKCGAIYLPLDPKFPKDRLEFMATDADTLLPLASGFHRRRHSRTIVNSLHKVQEHYEDSVYLVLVKGARSCAAVTHDVETAAAGTSVPN